MCVKAVVVAAAAQRPRQTHHRNVQIPTIERNAPVRSDARINELHTSCVNYAWSFSSSFVFVHCLRIVYRGEEREKFLRKMFSWLLAVVAHRPVCLYNVCWQEENKYNCTWLFIDLFSCEKARGKFRSAHITDGWQWWIVDEGQQKAPLYLQRTSITNDSLRHPRQALYNSWSSNRTLRASSWSLW